MSKTDLLYPDLTGNIINAAMEVHSNLGHGFLESVYEEAIAVEFDLRNINYERQKNIDVLYKDVRIKNFCCDILVEKKVILELKAIKQVTEFEHAQILNYLKATGIKVGLLINFGEKSLKFKRFVKEKSA